MEWCRALAAGLRTLSAKRLKALGSALACVAAGLVTPLAAAHANELASEPAPNVRLHAPLDKTLALRASGDVGKVIVSQPEVIEVGSAGQDALYVIGRQPGAANILVYDRQGRLSQTVDVEVGPDAEGLQESLTQALPDERITVTPVAGGVMLDGEVSSPGVAAIAEDLAGRAAPDAVLSRLTVRGAQVRLRVRILEISRRGLRDLGGELQLDRPGQASLALGSGPLGAEPPMGVATLRLTPGDYQLNARLRALETRGQLEIMAEPTLVARSGEPASFHAGGEIPYPTPDANGGLTLEFKPYGAALRFTPTIQPNGLVRLELDAQLSSVDPAVSLRVANVNVPALLVRRAATTADLGDGESYLIAGLFEDYGRRATRGPPWLGEIPVVGSLLRALQVADDRRELAIVVTPEVVDSVRAPTQRIATATETPPSPASAAPPSAAPPRREAPFRALASTARRLIAPPVAAARRLAAHVLSVASRLA